MIFDEQKLNIKQDFINFIFLKIVLIKCILKEKEMK